MAPTREPYPLPNIDRSDLPEDLAEAEEWGMEEEEVSDYDTLSATGSNSESETEAHRPASGSEIVSVPENVSIADASEAGPSSSVSGPEASGTSEASGPETGDPSRPETTPRHYVLQFRHGSGFVLAPLPLPSDNDDLEDED